ncbi:membrane protein insertion efficiency factor YidD [Eggerthellaceae bacterium PR-HUZ602407-17]
MFLKPVNKVCCFSAQLCIRAYQLILSPLFSGCCRFEPTCSQYALEAFKKFSFLKACYLTIRRILRCRPGGGHGYDPLP